MKKYNLPEYRRETIRLTTAAACESIARVIINSMYIPKKSVADLTYDICRALGFKGGL